MRRPDAGIVTGNNRSFRASPYILRGGEPLRWLKLFAKVSPVFVAGQTRRDQMPSIREGPMKFAVPPQVAEQNANLLLAALPPEELGRMLPLMDPVQVEVGEVLCEPGDRVRYVYFPQDCLVS